MSNFSCFSPNLSHDSLTLPAWSVDFYGDGLVRNVNIIAAILLLFFLLGVPWNVLIIVCVVKKRLYVQPGVILLLNLAVADLLLCVLVLPFNIVSGIAGEYIFGDSDAIRCMVCQTGIFLTLLTYMSFHTVTLMSVDRLLYLLKPLEYSSIVTPRRTILVILATWVLCVLLAILPLFKFGEMEFGVIIGTCALLLLGSGQTQTNTIYIIVLLVEVAVVALVLIVTNIAILVIVKRHLNKVYDLKKIFFDDTTKLRSQFSVQKNKIQIYLLRMLGAILLTNFVLLFPIIILAITATVVRFDRIPHAYVSFSYLTFMSQAVVHPLLESIFVRDIKSTVLYYCKCMCLKKTGKEAQIVLPVTMGKKCQCEVHNNNTEHLKAQVISASVVNNTDSSSLKKSPQYTSRISASNKMDTANDDITIELQCPQCKMSHTSTEYPSPQEPASKASPTADMDMGCGMLCMVGTVTIATSQQPHLQDES